MLGTQMEFPQYGLLYVILAQPQLETAFHTHYTRIKHFLVKKIVVMSDELKGAETNLYTFRYWLLSESIQICFRTL